MASKGLCKDNYHGDGHNVQDIASAPQTICYQTIPPASSSDNLNQNVAPNTLITDDPNCQEVSDVTSNAVINFIGQMMLEEDIDDDASIYYKEAAIQETEKSFYNLLGKEYPLVPALITYHTPQNCTTTKSTFSNTSEPLLTSGDPISALSTENLPASEPLLTSGDPMKFLPDLEKLFDISNPKRIEFHKEHKKINVSDNKAICSETNSKRCSLDDRESDLSEGRAHKQQAVYAEEPARNENLDQFLFSNWKDYVKEVTTVQEIMKQELKNKSWEHQVDTMLETSLEMKETGDGSVDLRSQLLHCSEAISANNYSRAYELINQIRKHASPKGDCSQRVAYYLVDALEARLVGTRSDIYHEIVSRQETVTDYLKAFRVYHAACPFMRATHYFSTQTILNVTKNATKIHIIDFGIQMGFLWPSFFERLSKLGKAPPKIRITGIEFPQKGFHPNKLVDETGRRLSEYADRFNIHLKYQGIASNWENIRIEDLNIETNEVLVVNCMYRLESLADETIDISCPRDKVLRMIREIKPNIFIHGIHNGSYGTPFFTSRFREVVSRCSAFFDMFESNMPRRSEARFHIERTLVVPKAINAVACEGSERVERPETYRQWKARNVRAGFLQLPLDSIIKKKIEYVVRELFHKEFVVVEDNKWLLLGWKGTILFGLSTWIPNEHRKVDSKTK